MVSDTCGVRHKSAAASAALIAKQESPRAATTDLLILSGLAPKTEHELSYLDRTIERRYQQRLSTILMTPEEPHELATHITSIHTQGQEIWQRLSERLYRTNLVAV